jgi:hypothetical protein
MIDMMSVNSDNISKIGYDETNNSLHIQYDDNSLYAYFNIELEMFTNLLFSASKANFFKENIMNKFHCSKIS